MSAKWLATVLGAACLCIMGATAMAEEKKAEAPPTMEPAKPSAEHAMLAKDAGKWKAVTKSMMDPTKPPQVSEGTEVCSLICGGLFLRSDFNSKDAKGEFHGSGVVGYDQKKKMYTGVWTDNFDTALYPYEGTCDANGKCVFTMQATGPDGQPTTYTMISEHMDADHRKFSMQAMGPDGKPFTIMTIDYTRM